MARDYLAIPGKNHKIILKLIILILIRFIFIWFFLLILGTSVPVERIFSGGIDLITKRRCSLGKETIQACMCMKNWIKKLQ